MAMTISIIPERKHAIRGMIDQKKSKIIRSRKVMFIKNSITTHSTPTAIKVPPAI